MQVIVALALSYALIAALGMGFIFSSALSQLDASGEKAPETRIQPVSLDASLERQILLSVRPAPRPLP